MELDLPQCWRVHNIFHTSLIKPYRTSVRGLWDDLITVTDSGYVDRIGVTHEVGYDVEGNQVLEDFEVEEIMGSHLVLTTVHRGSRRGSPRHPIKTSGAIKYLDIYLTRN